MTNLIDVASELSLSILSFLERISYFISQNIDLFLLIVPVGDVMSFISSTPILSRLMGLVQIF